ncbi:MAG: bifunctional phosphopantothenoylcysteine decarboxylase/phosphopantothenate--cysteine ligase CoaBC [Acidimicrobiia bacterium]
MLQGRRVLLCVTGGVAAYKSAYLARRLVESGASVRVVMTDSTHHFIGPQTFAAITGSHPTTTLFGDGAVSPHTENARWADLVIVAPMTAATLGRLANGISEDAVSASVLATEAPLLVAPAMHTEMWEQSSIQRNVARLEADGATVVGPREGELAGGDVGVGRVAEPEEIVDAARAILGGEGGGRSVLVTAGGTREPIDPVRYLGNRSSGKMGHAIADEAARRGYDVTLVTTTLREVHPAVTTVIVETADEMLSAVSEVEPAVAVMAAAVADFKPETTHEGKLARKDGLAEIELSPTPDILASVVAREQRPFTVGFAAETGGVERAIGKAKSKGVDLLVYNDVTEPGSGFGTDTNRVAYIDPDGAVEERPQLSKREVAQELWDRIAVAIGAEG